MASKLFHLIATFSLLSPLSLLLPVSSAQSCSHHDLVSKGLFRSCNDLPYPNSFIYWSYNYETGKLGVAFRRVGMRATPSKWVAWAINPNGLKTAMVGAQALVMFRRSDGTVIAYTSQISGYGTTLAESELMYPVSDMSGRFENGEMVLFGNLQLPRNTSVINQVWQEGPVFDDRPSQHALDPSNFQSKGTLNLISGQSENGGGTSSRLRKRNVHGVLNAVGWGILLPMGVIMARYVKVFADPAWFYLHMTCQISGVAIGTAGWATGLKLGSESTLDNTTHRNIGIALFTLATLQLLALTLRPKRDHKYRPWWNVYHRSVGYSIIILSIMNVARGLRILKPDEKWKHAYIGTVGSLFAIAVVLEACTWIVVCRRKKKIQNAPK